MENPFRWPEVLPRIQSLLNNTSSTTTGKTPNEIAYRFSPRRTLDLYSTATRPDTYVAHTEATNAISFALANHKEHYDKSHQPLVMKVGDWAMLKLHKGYSIPSSVSMTKKLTQQYVSPFQIVKKIGRLAYRLEVPSDWRIHPVFSVAQLEPAPNPSEYPFHRPRSQQPPSVFVEDDTDKHKSFEIDCLFNKRMVRKDRGLTIKYLMRWTGYGPEWDRWYNVKNLDNAADLVRAYEEGLTQWGRWDFSRWGEVVTVLPLFLPYPYFFPFLSLILLYYKTWIRLARVTWPDLISLSAHVTRSKHRCRLFYWIAEPALLVSREHMDKTLFRGI